MKLKPRTSEPIDLSGISPEAKQMVDELRRLTWDCWVCVIVAGLLLMGLVIVFCKLIGAF